MAVANEGILTSNYSCEGILAVRDFLTGIFLRNKKTHFITSKRFALSCTHLLNLKKMVQNQLTLTKLDAIALLVGNRGILCSFMI